MDDSNNEKDLKKKFMTAKEVQNEYLPMNVRKVRTFLNQYCTFRKIGNTYYYSRSEVEKLLCGDSASYEFSLDPYN